MPAKKKNTGTRRRTNKASTAAVLVPVVASSDDYDGLTVAQLKAELAARQLPPVRGRKADLIAALVLSDDPTPRLPQRRNDEGIEVDWRPETLEWWTDLWTAPMASEYHSSDRHALFLLAVLMDDFWHTPTSKLAAEIRLQRQAFGLTPYDRRRLEWTIMTTEEAKEHGTGRRTNRGNAVEPPAPAQPDAATDPRLHLVQ